jgi:hypothetical protein
MAFEIKQKEPVLSPEMQDLIYKTHGDGNGEKYDDIERYKYLIMKLLTEDQDIINTLHNKDLEGQSGDAYRNVNIYSFLKIPDTQSVVKNFICFEVEDIEVPRYSEILIRKNIVFRTISHEDDYKTDYGINRQDLLAAIIKSKFDWSNIFGMHIEKVYDRGRVAENGYYYREFIFETTVVNNLVNKAKNGGVVYGGK